MTKIAVGIVSYNTRKYLRACLQSVIAEGADEIVVVDNASSDGSSTMVGTGFPQVQLRVNTTNRGFGAAANQAVASCGAPYVLLLNADTVLHEGTIRALETHLDRHPQAGIVGPRLVNLDGSLQASCFPFPIPVNVFLELSNLSAVVQHLPVMRERYLRSWRHDRVRVVPWVLGAALAIRREAFDAVGGFDESFFMYSEESDLCYRLHARGWQTHFTPEATIVHVGGVSTVQYRTTMAARALTSTIDFYRRHYSRGQLLQLKLIMIVSMLAKMARDRVHLLSVRDPLRRARLIEDLQVWRHVLSKIMEWR